MTSISRIQDGISRYAEQELCSKMSGWQRMVVATGVGLLSSKLPEVAKSLPLGLANENEIDVDAIYNEARQHFNQPVEVKFPAIGTITFTVEDLDKLYRMI